MSFNSRSLIMGLVALVAAVGTAMLARNWLLAERNQNPGVQPVAAVTMTQVMVAKASLPSGHILRPDDVRWQNWPDDGVGENYLTNKNGQSLDAFAGAVVRRGIATGTPLTSEQVVKPGDRGFLAAVLTPGMRAVSVPISATSGISGFVFPGDRVDLILTHEVARPAGPHRASETVLVNVRVLAVDQRMDNQQNKPALGKTATLELTPRQVEQIAVAQRMGALSLSLRSLAVVNAKLGAGPEPFDAPPGKGTSYTWDSDVSRLIPPVNSPTSLRQVMVSRGGKLSAVQFGSVSK